ncbi:MAG TPA: AAA family ATPase [candidate division Zixibacteria bacterium]|nr:AAA family ATPase [candidate division Zixibacteria bacterium]
MARFVGMYTEDIYGAAKAWKDKCLLSNGSLLWDGEQVWTRDNLSDFKRRFVEQPDTSGENFAVKFKKQLEGGVPNLYRLAIEVLYVHFLFTDAILGPTKLEWLKKIAGWHSDLTLPTDKPLLKALNGGIANPGGAYNMGRWEEMSAITLIALNLLQQNESERVDTLSDHRQTRNFIEDVCKRGEDNYKGLEHLSSAQTPSILLHLLFPDYYERMASSSHKESILIAFSGLIEEEPEAHVDDRLYALRQMLQGLLGKDPQALDFYKSPLSEVWWTKSALPTELDPILGLKSKKQIVFYGPPGTGKTFGARELSEKLIRQGILGKWGAAKYFQNYEEVKQLCAERYKKVQFHPAFGYEDFIRGMQLTDGGKTEYRNGVLLDILEKLLSETNDEQDLPFVLILDEMNRADLSRVLGECFSLIEDRGQSLILAGSDSKPVTLPKNLFIIGTMNLIDQSLEQVDFALRRRFIWFLKDYSSDEFISICEYRWRKIIEAKQVLPRWSFDFLAPEFHMLAERATMINSMIREYHDLGDQYEIGHTYFADIVDLLKLKIAHRKQKGKMLFTMKGEWHVPVQQLWTHSLKPLLNQYLSGTDPNDRDEFLKRVEDVLRTGTDK